MRLCDWLTQQHQTLTQSLASPVLRQAHTGLTCSPPHDPHRRRLLAASRRDLVRTPSPFLSFSLSLTLFLSVSLVSAPAPVPFGHGPTPLLSLIFSFFLSFSLSLFSLSFSSLFLWFFLSLLTFHFNHTVIDSLYYYNYTTIWVLYFSYLVLPWCGVDCELWLVWFIDFILWSLWPCGWEIENNWSSGR